MSSTTDTRPNLEQLAARADVTRFSETIDGSESGPDYDRILTTYSTTHVANSASLKLEVCAWADGETDTTARLYAADKPVRVRASVHAEGDWFSVAISSTVADDVRHDRELIAHLSPEGVRALRDELNALDL